MLSGMFDKYIPPAPRAIVLHTVPIDSVGKADPVEGAALPLVNILLSIIVNIHVIKIPAKYIIPLIC